MDKSKDTNYTNEDIEKLREHLATGGGGELVQHLDNDSVPDDAVVNEFLSMFNSSEDTALKAHEWKIHIPSHIYNNEAFIGDLYGIARKETESFYIIDAPTYTNNEHLVGKIVKSDANDVSADDITSDLALIGQRLEDGNVDFSVYINGVKQTKDRNIASIKTYDMVTNLFSRNTGLLESQEMLDKRALLVGCGSVGSYVAMQLARSGVGKFVLCDTDTLEVHNICRHQCGFDDLGRYKVDAVKDKILNINPNAEVIVYRSIIQRVPEDELDALLGRNTIIIGGGDNRGSADWACKLAIKSDSTFVATSCWTRAFAGEIFYWASGRNLSCYTCALGGLIDDERPESHANYFGMEEEKDSLAFEPGIATDIDFVTTIAVKLALDLINRDNENYTPRVINYLRQYTWICNTNSTKIGGERAGIFAHPLQITNTLSVNKDDDCQFCGNK